MKLYHYFEKNKGPFYNLSDLNLNKAEEVLHKIRENKDVFASKRNVDYMKRRFEYEDIVRNLFIMKNGIVTRNRPHYMTLGECSWLKEWYEDGQCISIDVEKIDTSCISFTYGDMFPVFGPNGEKSAWYRKKVYKYEEILEKIKLHGMPQENNINGEKGPIRYIEAQVWSNEIINTIIRENNDLK